VHGIFEQDELGLQWVCNCEDKDVPRILANRAGPAAEEGTVVFAIQLTAFKQVGAGEGDFDLTVPGVAG